MLTFAPARADAQVTVLEEFRVGATPAYEGSGWIGEAFLDIPDDSAQHLLSAESYVRDRTPDFTFRTDWIDFPAGPLSVDLDANFETIGDFLNDYIHDVSDPALLDTPFGHFLLRFSGFLAVRMTDDVSLTENHLEQPGLPVWIETGTNGYDGYRTFIGDDIYRVVVVDPENGFHHVTAIIHATGLFPTTITYFNRYDPNGESEPSMGRAGIELYSWHGGGLAWPAGDKMVHPMRGSATLVPPRVVYQAEDILPVVKGDFNADSNLDLLDYRWFETCFTGALDGGIVLSLGCDAHDFDDDNDVDADDLAEFQAAIIASRSE